jgi:hypothetical protein
MISAFFRGEMTNELFLAIATSPFDLFAPEISRRLLYFNLFALFFLTGGDMDQE